MLFQLLIFNVFNVLFDSLFSFSQCLLHFVVKTWCLFPSFHGRGCTFQRGWRSIRREEAWAVLCIEVSGCCEWAPLPCKASKFGIKMIKLIKLISSWSWLLRDSSCSDAKPSLEEALPMCSGTLWLANSDTFGYFWILLDTFGYFWILLESWANVWQFCYVMSWNSAVQSCIRCFSSFWYLMCWMSFLIHFSLSVSVFCMSLSKHDVCFQASMEEAVPSKEAEEASDEKRREPFFVLRCLAVVNEHHYHAKLPSLASKWSNWSNLSPADLDCSGIARAPMPNPVWRRLCQCVRGHCHWQTLTLLDTFGYFWILLDTFGYFWILLDTFGYFWILLDTFGYFWILLDTFGYFWILLDTFGVLSQCLTVL